MRGGGSTGILYHEGGGSTVLQGHNTMRGGKSTAILHIPLGEY